MKPEIIKNNCWHMSHSALSKFNTISLTRDVELHSHNQYKKNLVLYLFPVNINTLKINDENVNIIHNCQNFNHTCQKENWPKRTAVQKQVLMKSVYYPYH